MPSPKKYDSRPSPSWSANDTPGERHEGNDGNMWISEPVASGKYHRWKRYSETKSSPKKSPAKKGKKSSVKKGKKTPVKKGKKSPAKKSLCPMSITRGDVKLTLLSDESTTRMCSYKRTKSESLKKGKKTCPAGKIMNPASGRCVSRTGKIGKNL